MNSRWFKTREAREYCAMGEKQFARELKLGLITHVRLPSGHLRFHPDDLNHFMRRYEINGKASPEVKAAADSVMRKV